MPAKQAGSPHGAYCWWGGALASGKASGDSGHPSFFLRWYRILLITGWFSIQRPDVSAMALTAPPRREQISTSISPEAPTVGKHSFKPLSPSHGRSSFVVHQAFCLLLNHSFVYFSLALLVWLLADTYCWMVWHSDKNTVKPRVVDSRFEHQWFQFCNEIQWFKYEVHGHTNAE